VRESARKLAEGIGVRGLMNVQFALAQDILYVLEANPRASRTVPFVAKATGVPLAAAASRIMLGASIQELRDEGLLPVEGDGGHTARARADVGQGGRAALPPLPHRADGAPVDSLLGPEMRSTGEVMGIDKNFGLAFAKSQLAAYGGLPESGTVFVSVANRDKRAMLFPVSRLVDLGFEIVATTGTADVLRRNGIDVSVVRKITERSEGASGEERTIADLVLAGEIAMIINTPTGQSARADGYAIRAAANTADVTLITTVQEFAAAVQAIDSMRKTDLTVTSLQEHAAALDLLGRGREKAGAGA
jgi:carbamoyl-phosphate synthase large subunit